MGSKPFITSSLLSKICKYCILKRIKAKLVGTCVISSSDRLTNLNLRIEDFFSFRETEFVYLFLFSVNVNNNIQFRGENMWWADQTKIRLTNPPFEKLFERLQFNVRSCISWLLEVFWHGLDWPLFGLFQPYCLCIAFCQISLVYLSLSIIYFCFTHFIQRYIYL